jgi:hypothetical protein
MTAQVSEVLYYDNQRLPMFAIPLTDYFSLTKSEPKFRVDCTAIWRGYVGTWEVVQSRLYLIKIDGHFNNDDVITLSSLFPDFPDRVFANWYSGELRASKGELIDCSYGGFSSIYEQDILFKIENGLLAGIKIQNN